MPPRIYFVVTKNLLDHNRFGELASSTTSSFGRKVAHRWGIMAAEHYYGRFKQFSAGGGNWAPKKSFSVSPLILRDTDSLLEALNPRNVAAPGRLHDIKPFEARVGFGGGASHPKARMSIAKLADIHNSGKGVTKRPIITPLPRHVRERMIEMTMKQLRILERRTVRRD